ncbi:hypothetical protein EV178_000013 [Coemansia sp. RSA 1646]|nr:hypothetical protein EV178_000013 [Coemansia sp. RSA 1646]KAJ1772347.1 hypothetical protein LPJ74_001612 [Coemansia sp. RSA 1843]KAJ2093285.1 hypothetical protein IW138_000578 [Coemansia sp. RSA 986]
MASNNPGILTLFQYGDVPSVQFSSKSVVVSAADESDLEGTIRIDDIPTVDQLHLSMDNGGGQVKRTIIFNEVVAYEMQQRPSLSDGRQVYQVCGRTIEGKSLFPFDQFTGCVHVAATHMAQNVSAYGGEELAKYSNIGFWSPRIRMLYDRAFTRYMEVAEAQDADPSMLSEELFVVAQVSVRPFSLSLSLYAFPFSDTRTCQVRVCKGLRPESFLRDFHLSADPLGLTRLITPPMSDVVLLHPTTQRLSEGLLSNFFATRFMPPPASSLAPVPQKEESFPPSVHRSNSSSDANATYPDADGRMTVARTKFYNYHLVCASLDIIHRGEMLDAVWSICKRDGIQVSFAGPNLNDALSGRWSGAFIINSTYQLLPIDTMYLTDRRNTRVELGTCPLITHLKTEIQKLFHGTS